MRVMLEELKTYALEVYGPEDPDHLLWRHDSEAPFSPMGCGDRLVLPEAAGAKTTRPYRIVEIEHVIWVPPAGDVRYVTRVTVEWAGADRVRSASA